ncbi:hypothetical protein NLG97_g3772 [Lecanicillium saksenae]|uniref:Uncharacterized protein n=1 Tax=Lecanicillium saksenae TaxID=468837 RepID=A0ACC1R0G5_9HYPO|nr:hypothetical protein NLG97_g3772 [Lecanicillium saksenae]
MPDLRHSRAGKHVKTVGRTICAGVTVMTDLCIRAPPSLLVEAAAAAASAAFDTPAMLRTVTAVLIWMGQIPEQSTMGEEEVAFAPVPEYSSATAGEVASASVSAFEAPDMPPAADTVLLLHHQVPETSPMAEAEAAMGGTSASASALEVVDVPVVMITWVYYVPEHSLQMAARVVSAPAAAFEFADMSHVVLTQTY